MTAPALTIAQILDHQSPLTDLPTFGRMTGQADSTIYQLAKEGRLPLELIRLGRKRYVRTVDVWKFLGLTPAENDDAAGSSHPAAPIENASLASSN